jgi:TolA-binding protein
MAINKGRATTADEVVKTELTDADKTIAKAKDFWGKYSKQIIIGALALFVVVGGWFAYKNFFQMPAEQKAAEASFKAEQYFEKDSLTQALNGDGANLGFVKLADKFSGTKLGELNKYRAGVCYLRLEDYKNAIKFLDGVKLDSKPIQARAYCALGDALTSDGKMKEGAEMYMKAGAYFPEDETNSSEYLFRAAMAFDKLNDSKNAIDALKMIKEKYPRTEVASKADKYLGKMGELK